LFGIESRDESISKHHFLDLLKEGFFQCDYFIMAYQLGQYVLQAAEKRGAYPILVQALGMDKPSFVNRLAVLRENVEGSSRHTSCPIIYEGCSENSLRYIGGYSEFYKDKNYSFHG
jgi:hypothetical protein